jgi:hypothetical protein
MNNPFSNTAVPNLPLFVKRLRQYMKRYNLGKKTTYTIGICCSLNHEDEIENILEVRFTDRLVKALAMLPYKLQEEQLKAAGLEYYSFVRRSINLITGSELDEVAEEVKAQIAEHHVDIGKYLAYFLDFEKTQEAQAPYYESFVKYVSKEFFPTTELIATT